MSIGNYTFKGYGPHANTYNCPYLTIAAAIGGTKDEMDLFLKRLENTIYDYKQKQLKEKKEKEEKRNDEIQQQNESQEQLKYAVLGIESNEEKEKKEKEQIRNLETEEVFNFEK